MHSATTRKNLLDKVHALLSEYLGDECPEDENFEDFDPEIDAIRTEIGDLLEQETERLAAAPTEPSEFVVGIEFKSGFDIFATETYRIEAIDWPAAKCAAFALADNSPYTDDRIPDLQRFAIDRTGEEWRASNDEGARGGIGSRRARTDPFRSRLCDNSRQSRCP